MSISATACASSIWFVTRSETVSMYDVLSDRSEQSISANKRGVRNGSLTFHKNRSFSLIPGVLWSPCISRSIVIGMSISGRPDSAASSSPDLH